MVKKHLNQVGAGPVRGGLVVTCFMFFWFSFGSLADNNLANYKRVGYTVGTDPLANDSLVDTPLVYRLADDPLANDSLADDLLVDDPFADDSQNRITTLQDLRAEYEESAKYYIALLDKVEAQVDWNKIVDEKQAVLDKTTYLLSWCIQNKIPQDSEEFKQANEAQKQAWEEWSEAISQRNGDALIAARKKMQSNLEKLNQALKTEPPSVESVN